MRRLEFRIGEVEGQAASVFERAARRAAYGKHIAGRGRRCLQGEIKIRFQPFPPPGPRCAKGAVGHRGRMQLGGEEGRRARGASTLSRRT